MPRRRYDPAAISPEGQRRIELERAAYHATLPWTKVADALPTKPGHYLVRIEDHRVIGADWQNAWIFGPFDKGGTVIAWTPEPRSHSV